MSVYQASVNLSTKKVTVQANGQVVPASFTKVGTFEHGGNTDPLEYPVNHVLFHHVQELLYHVSAKNAAQTAKFPDNITNLNDFQIILDSNIAVTGVTIAPNTANLSLAGTKTQQLTPTFAPTGASNKAVTYTTSDATKATVSATGLVTGIAVGTATITVHTTDGNKTDTCVVTVAA